MPARWLALAVSMGVAVSATAQEPLGVRPMFTDRVLSAAPNAQAITTRIWVPGLDDGYVPQGLTVIDGAVYVGAYKSIERQQDRGPCRLFRIDPASDWEGNQARRRGQGFVRGWHCRRTVGWCVRTRRRGKVLPLFASADRGQGYARGSGRVGGARVANARAGRGLRCGGPALGQPFDGIVRGIGAARSGKRGRPGAIQDASRPRRPQLRCPRALVDALGGGVATLEHLGDVFSSGVCVRSGQAEVALRSGTI